MDTGPILVVDDDPDILTILKDNLELDGYPIAIATTGREALKIFEEQPPRLIILDLYLPDIDGIQVCRRIRDKSNVPIIMLTARDRVADKVLGLESGADDYVVKPFDYLELAARIKACLRRQAPFLQTTESLQLGSLRIDPRTHTVSKEGEVLKYSGDPDLLRIPDRASADRLLTTKEQAIEYVLEQFVPEAYKSTVRVEQSFLYSPGWFVYFQYYQGMILRNVTVFVEDNKAATIIPE